MAKVRITQVRSQIGQTEKHRGTLRALGFSRFAILAAFVLIGIGNRVSALGSELLGSATVPAPAPHWRS